MPGRVWRVSQVYGVLGAVLDPGFGLSASQVPRDVPLIAVLRVASLTSLQELLEEAFAVTIPFNAVKRPTEGLVHVIADLLAQEGRLDRNAYAVEPGLENDIAELIERLHRDFQAARDSPPPPRYATDRQELHEPGHDARSEYWMYRVWYGTNRQERNVALDRVPYTGARGDLVFYGSCDVVIPKSHQIGSVGSPWWKRLWTAVDDRIRVSRVFPDTEDAFWRNIREVLGRDPDNRDAVVFLHGYNVSFEEAAIRAAQIGFDLQVPGTMAFFSWPSRGSVLGYGADIAAIEASEAFMADFLARFASDSGAERVHVIAHSMGNRGLLRAMHRIVGTAQKKSGIRFGQLILAAPDVDTAVFKELAGVYVSISDRTTLYVSDADKALASSGFLHQYPRAGFAPPITIVPNIDTVRVTNVDLTLLGHGYIGEARDVLHDMHSLLRQNAPPKERMGLRPLQAEDGGVYWEIGK